MAQDKRSQLYNNLIQSGKVTVNEIGSPEQFSQAIRDEQTARQFYKNLINSGKLTPSEIGDEDAFYGSISSDFSVSVPSNASRGQVAAVPQRTEESQSDAVPAARPNFLTKMTDSLRTALNGVNDVKADGQQVPYDQKATANDSRKAFYENRFIPSSVKKGVAEMVGDDPYVSEGERKTLSDEIRTRLMARATPEQRREMLEQQYGEEINKEFDKQLAEHFDEQDIARRKSQVDKMRQEYLKENLDYLDEQYQPELENVRQIEKEEEEQRDAEKEAFLREHPQYDKSRYADIEEKYNRPLEEGESAELRQEFKRLAKEERYGELKKEEALVRQTNAEIEEKRLQRRLDEAEQRRKESAPLGDFRGFIPSEEEEVLQSALRQRQKEIRIIQAERDDAGFLQGIADAAVDPSFWTLGLSDVSTALRLNDIKNDIESGKELTESQKMLLDATVGVQEAEGMYSNNRGFWYNAANVTVNAVPFVGEFILTGGGYNVISGAFKAGGKALAKNVSNRLANAAIRYTGTAIGDIASALTMATTTGGARTLADIEQRYLGQVEKTDDGYMFVDGEDWGEAITDGLVANTLEYYTEKLGGHLDFVGKSISRLAGRVGRKLGIDKGIEKLGLSKLSPVLTRIKGSDFYQQGNALLKKGGVHELPSEVIEEEANILLNAALVGDNQFSDLWDAKTQLDLVGGLAVSIGFMRALPIAGGVYKAGQYYRYKHATDVADTVANYRLTEEKWAPLKEQIDNATNEEFGGVLQSVIDNPSLEDQEKEAVADYAIKLLKMRGYNLGTIADAKDRIARANDAEPDETVADAANDGVERGYQEGYQTANAAARKQYADEADAAAEQVRELFDEDDQQRIFGDDYTADYNTNYYLAHRDEYTDEQIMAAVDYYQKRARVEGMMDGAENAADLQVQQENAKVRSNTHQGTGQVITATRGGEQFYVVGGDIVTDPETGLDTLAGTGGAVVVKNTQTGEVKVLSPQELSIQSVQDAQQLIDYNENELRQQLMQQAENDMTYGEPADINYDSNSSEDFPNDEKNQHENGNNSSENIPEDDNIPSENIPKASTSLSDTQPVEKNTGKEQAATAASLTEEPSAMSRIAVDESGEPVWEKSPVEDTLAALRERVGEEQAMQMVDEEISDLSKELESTRKKKVKRMNERLKRAEAIKGIEKRIAYWQSVKDEAIRQEEPVEEVAPEHPQATIEEAVPIEEKTLVENGTAAPVIPQPEQPVVSEQPQQPVTTQPQQPAIAQPQTPSAEERVAAGSVKNNIGKTFEYVSKDGRRSEVRLDSMDREGNVSMTVQRYDAQGRPEGKPVNKVSSVTDVGNSIIKKTLRPVKDTDGKLRDIFKGKPLHYRKTLDVLTDEEKERLLRVYQSNDEAGFNDLYNELQMNHFADAIMKERDDRNIDVERILSGPGSKEEKLRKIRKLYQGNSDAEMFLSDESMAPAPDSLEEYVADLLGNVPKRGTGTLAYYSYENGNNKITGLQDESGYGKRGFAGDTKGFEPWLAPKGKGMSLTRFAETIHSQLPESVQEQYDVQAVRNALLNVFQSADRPSDIPLTILRNRVKNAEDALRREEDEVMEGGTYYQKVSLLDRNRGVASESREQAVRDALIEILREAGIEVIDDEEGQRVLDEANGKARLMAVRKNIENGIDALQRIADGEESVSNAMTRDDLSQYGGDNNITFYYGKTGDPAKNYKGGYGIAHIGGKHGADTLLRVLNVIADGKIDRYVPGNKTVVLTDGEYEAVLALTRFGDKETWLFNGWKKDEKTGADGEVSTHSDATQANPTFSREDLGAVLSDAKLRKKSETSKESEEKIKQQKIEKPAFYSNAMKALEGIKQEKATPEQWLAMITKAGGLKAGEDKWMGLSEWLASPSPSEGGEKNPRTITKQEVLDFIRKNQIEIEEDTYTEHPQGFEELKREYDQWLHDEGYDYAWEQLRERFGDDAEIAFGDMGGELTIDNGEAASVLLGSEKPINDTRLDYTTEGLQNKREIALVVPTVEPWNESDEIHFGDAGEGRAVAWVRFGETTDKDGKKVLVIDEIQSKRHQEGREKGYKDKAANDKLEEARKKVDFAQKEYDHYVDMLKKEHEGEAFEDFYSELPKLQMAMVDALEEDVYKASAEYEKAAEEARGIPDAPFDKNWHELAMKRMLRYAAENGYDKVAWTKGAQQAERYNIGKAVNRITISKVGDEQYRVDTWGNGGRSVEGASGVMTPEQMAETFGKDLSVRLMTAADNNKEPGPAVIAGDGLRIGGEGMKGFYDQMLPRFMDKYGKKWGVKTGEIELPGLEWTNAKNSLKMWSVDVTPEMKESVMQGQPMFFKTPSGEAYGYTLNGKIYIDPRIATSETPIHEYGHLWAAMKRQTAPEEWKNIKEVLLKDKLVKPFIDKVKKEYPELLGEGKEDDFIEEVLTQYSGRRGAERMREVAEEIAKENGGVFGKAQAVEALRRMRNLLARFWQSIADMMGWRYTNAEEIADKVLSDLLEGVNPNESLTPKPSPKGEGKAKGEVRPQKKLESNYSEEKDEFGKRFVLSKDGTANFGKMEPDSGLADVPIRLSEGEDYVDEDGKHHGYGLLHIEAGHGDQIRGAGYDSVEDFVETIARNYRRILEGNEVANNQTYLLELTDEHNNTLFVQLSRDGKYWNINSAGVFKKSYSKNKKVVYERPEEETNALPALGDGTITDTIGVNHGQAMGEAVTSRNSPKVSNGKGTEKKLTDQEKSEENAEILREGEAQAVSLQNNKELTPKQMRERQAFAERQWRRAHEQADETVKKLNLGDNVTIVDSIDELEGHKNFSDRKKAAKGWYDPKTGKIVIVMGNHNSPTDVVKSILHEGVAHHGLRKLFGERFDTFLDNAYKSAYPSIQEEIVKLSEKYGNDTRKATEEYLARLAEDTDFENAENKPWLRHWFNQIKEAFLNMLRELGLPGFEKKSVILTDNELRYLLWRSYKNLSEPGRYRNVFQAAKDIQMQQQLGVGQFDRSRDSKESQQESGNGEEIGKAADVVNMFPAINQRQRELKEKDPDALFVFKMPDGSYRAVGDDVEAVGSAFGRGAWGNDANSSEYNIPEDRIDLLLPRLVRQGYRIGIVDAPRDDVAREGEDDVRFYDKSAVKIQKKPHEYLIKKGEGFTSDEFGKFRSTAIGEHVVKEDAAKLLHTFKNTSEEMPEVVEFTDENYNKMFGNGIETPIGHVKMSDNQKQKMSDKSRENYMSLAKRTLEAPDMIIQKPSEAKEGQVTERPFSYVFVKTFKNKDGKLATYFFSVSVKKDGMEVSMSNYIPGENQVKRDLREGTLAYIREVTLPSESGTSTQGDQSTLPAGEISSAGKVTENSETDQIFEENFDDKDENELFRDGEEEEDNNETPRFQRVSTTPSERDRSNYEADLKKWKTANGLPEDAEAPEKPAMQEGERALDYAKRVMEYRRKEALWKTAPKIEDYTQKREDAETSHAAHIEEKANPNSHTSMMKRVAADLQRLRHAVSRQKAYDKATVKAVTDFAQEFMNMGFGDNLSKNEMSRMLSSVKNATGAKNIKKEVDNILNVLMDNHLRNLENSLQKIASIRELKQTAQGVETQGKLELKGQRMIQAYREARQSRMTADQLRERLGEIEEKMSRSGDQAEMWEQEYEGVSLALQYAENIEASRSEFASLQNEYKDAVKEYGSSGRSYQEQQEYLESLEEAMQENKMERIGMYGELIGRLQGDIIESVEGAKEFVEKEKSRVKNIHRMANMDLGGMDFGAFRKERIGQRIMNSSVARFFLQPLATFEQMLRQFGSRSATGEGYLYHHFMGKWREASGNAWKGEKAAKEELDAKAREIFGDKIKRWSDLYSIVRKLPTVEVGITDQGERKTLKLTQGNLLYVVMADKMADGRMKLRRMGITEEKVEQLKEKIDPKLLELGEWLQEEYLVNKREAYNKVHERMFGAPMAAIDHYFPIKVLSDARYQEQDVSTATDSDAALPSTITGSIIKRRRNSLPLDILGTDALSLAVEHVEQMERWAAFAEFNKDVNTLLSYTTFRNRVKNMTTVYGGGEQLWNNFRDTARMAAGTYEPKARKGSIDKAISNIAKGVTAAKISFRVYTALKQILSAPAFLHDANIKDFAVDAVTPWKAWNWAMENMPLFEKRFMSRQAGDTRLMENPTDWKMWQNDIVQKLNRWGMSPNAFIDAVTCAVGAHSIYKTRLKRLKKLGMSDAVAHKEALKVAELGYNLTQQSSEGAMVSAIQKDRTMAANMLSVFRNSSFSYTRQAVDALRNLKHRLQKGYKEDAVKFMAGVMMEKDDTLSREQAEKAAESEYKRALWHDMARAANMMFVVTVLWNLGQYLPYLIFGGDDDEKEKMLHDAMLKGLLAGPVEGFAGGSIISDMTGLLTSGQGLRDYDVNPLPLFSDVQNMINHFSYDTWAGIQDVFNILVQSGIGVNPQTLTDAVTAIIDASRGDMSTAREIALLTMRILNVPSASADNYYIDELGMKASDAKRLSQKELAERYADYKFRKNVPLTGWFYSDEAEAKRKASLIKQFDKKVKERVALSDYNELRDRLATADDEKEKKMIADAMTVQANELTDGELLERQKEATDSVEQRVLSNVIKERTKAFVSGTSNDVLRDSINNASSPDRKNAFISEYAKSQGTQDYYGRSNSNKEYQRLRTYEDVREDIELGDLKKKVKDSNNKEAMKAINRLTKKISNQKNGFTGDEEADEEMMNDIRYWRREAIGIARGVLNDTDNTQE